MRIKFMKGRFKKENMGNMSKTNHQNISINFS